MAIQAAEPACGGPGGRRASREGTRTKTKRKLLTLADGTIGNLQQWLLGTHHAVSRDQPQVLIWMNSYFVTIGGKRRWRRSKHCSDLELGINPPNTRRYGVHPPGRAAL